MKGIAETAEIPFPLVFILNFAYEFSSACTGILIRNSENQIVHGRNLDFPFFGYFSKLVAKVEVRKGNKLLANLDQIIGFVFAITGQRDQEFAIEVNTRMQWKEFLNVLKNIVVNQYLPSCALVR